MKGNGKGAAKAAPAKGAGKGRAGRGGLSIPQAAMQQARAQVQAAEAPILEQIAQERAANAAKAQQQIGFSKAAAAIMQQAAPQVQTDYSNAANADAGYSRGLGDQVQQALNQNTDSSNAFLTQMGTPDSALKPAAPVGDIAYGMQGYIPATTLQREGAGFEAAAQLEPGNILSAGQQQAAQILGNDPQLTTLQNSLAKIAATAPDVYQKVVTALQAEADKQQQLALSRASLQQRASYENASLKARTQYENLELGLRQQGMALTRQKDRVAIEEAIRKGQAPDPSLSRLYGHIVDSNGNAIPNKQGKLIPVTSSSSSKTGGFTPYEVLHLKQTAGNIAAGAFNGVPATTTSPALPKLNYRQAMREMRKEGIPTAIAKEELRLAGYVPGTRGTPGKPPPDLFSGFTGLFPLGKS